MTSQAPDDFELYLRAAGKAASTASFYARTGRRIKASGLTPAEWLDSFVTPTTPENTARVYRSVACHYRAYLHDVGARVLGLQPRTDVRRLPSPVRIKGLEPAELEAFVAAVMESSYAAPAKAVLRLLPVTGLRLVELCGLERSKVGREGRDLVAQWTNSRGIERRFVFNDDARDVFRWYIPKSGVGRWLFPATWRPTQHLSPDVLRSYYLSDLRKTRLGSWAADLTSGRLRATCRSRE